MKIKMVTPICWQCGTVLKGLIPLANIKVVCFFCNNPMPPEEEEPLTNWKDKIPHRDTKQ